jgi:hypothetical protein
MPRKKNSTKKRKLTSSVNRFLLKLKQPSNRLRVLKKCPNSVIQKLSKVAKHRDCKKFVKKSSDKHDLNILASKIPIKKKRRLLINNVQEGGNLLTGILGFIPKLLGGLFNFG